MKLLALLFGGQVAAVDKCKSTYPWACADLDPAKLAASVAAGGRMATCGNAGWGVPESLCCNKEGCPSGSVMTCQNCSRIPCSRPCESDYVEITRRAEEAFTCPALFPFQSADGSTCCKSRGCVNGPYGPFRQASSYGVYFPIAHDTKPCDSPPCKTNRFLLAKHAPLAHNLFGDALQCHSKAPYSCQDIPNLKEVVEAGGGLSTCGNKSWGLPHDLCCTKRGCPTGSVVHCYQNYSYATSKKCSANEAQIWLLEQAEAAKNLCPTTHPWESNESTCCETSGCVTGTDIPCASPPCRDNTTQIAAQQSCDQKAVRAADADAQAAAQAAQAAKTICPSTHPWENNGNTCCETSGCVTGTDMPCASPPCQDNTAALAAEAANPKNNQNVSQCGEKAPWSCVGAWGCVIHLDKNQVHNLDGRGYCCNTKGCDNGAVHGCPNCVTIPCSNYPCAENTSRISLLARAAKTDCPATHPWVTNEKTCCETSGCVSGSDIQCASPPCQDNETQLHLVCQPLEAAAQAAHAAKTVCPATHPWESNDNNCCEADGCMTGTNIPCASSPCRDNTTQIDLLAQAQAAHDAKTVCPATHPWEDNDNTCCEADGCVTGTTMPCASPPCRDNTTQIDLLAQAQAAHDAKTVCPATHPWESNDTTCCDTDGCASGTNIACASPPCRDNTAQIALLARTGQNGSQTPQNVCPLTHPSHMGGSTCCQTPGCVTGSSLPCVSPPCSDYNAQNAQTPSNVCPETHPWESNGNTCCETSGCVSGSSIPCVSAPCSDNIAGQFPCPSKECWLYDETNQQCSMKAACAALTCGGTSFDITFKSALFNLDDNQNLVTFAGTVPAPAWNAVDTEWTATTPMGANGMTYTIDNVNNEIKMSILYAIVGDNMNTRSDDNIEDHLIKLGAKTVVTTPFGAGVIFECTYPLTVDISNEDGQYTVHGASVIDVYTAYGSLSSGFEMELNNGDDPTFILGSILPVQITWTINAMFQTLTFYLDHCTVTHGSTTIQIVQGGCYAAELDVVKEASLQGFTYKVFKGVGETTSNQEIECSVNICERNNCGMPTSNSQCPTLGDNAFYRYEI